MFSFPGILVRRGLRWSLPDDGRATISDVSAWCCSVRQRGKPGVCDAVCCCYSTLRKLLAAARERAGASGPGAGTVESFLRRRWIASAAYRALAGGARLPKKQAVAGVRARERSF